MDTAQRWRRRVGNNTLSKENWKSTKKTQSQYHRVTHRHTAQSTSSQACVSLDTIYKWHNPDVPCQRGGYHLIRAVYRSATFAQTSRGGSCLFFPRSCCQRKPWRWHTCLEMPLCSVCEYVSVNVCGIKIKCLGGCVRPSRVSRGPYRGRTCKHLERGAQSSQARLAECCGS